MAKRYDQMFALIDKVKPQTIVEIGVHRGIRGAKLCSRALEHRKSVRYVGYDVFDTVSEEYQSEALNGKGAPSKANAEARLAGCGSGLTFEFVIGDTRDTLHGKTVEADFAFIDGDHRVDAIVGDYAALADARCVVFDDYYIADAGGIAPDLEQYGANQMVDALREAGAKVDILPIGDACKHGGYSHLAVVWK